MSMLILKNKRIKKSDIKKASKKVSPLSPFGRYKLANSHRLKANS